MLGSLPPLRALSAYCAALAGALSQRGRVNFLSFKKIYPRALYPGGDLHLDPTLPVPEGGTLQVQRRMTWYNPFTWLRAGLCTPGLLLHAQWWSLPLLPVYLVVCAGFRARRRPVIITVHNVSAHEATPAFVALSRALFRLGEHFIVHSEENRQRFAELYGMPPARVRVIPHGPLAFAGQERVERDEIRAEMGYDPSHRVLLLFGAVRPYKGLDTALEAFTAIARTHPQARLLVAGKPWEPWDRYGEMIQRLGIADRVQAHLHFIPSGRVHRFFQVADLVLLPYLLFDSQSGVGAAALAFGKPLIVTNQGGLPDLVRDPRFVVPAGDPASLAEAITFALDTPGCLEQMAADSRALAAEMDWDVISARTWSLYEEVLGRKTEGRRTGGAQ